MRFLMAVLALWQAGCGSVSKPNRLLPGGGVGKWIANQKMDPIDDTMDVFAILPSEDFVFNRSGAVLQTICFGSGEAFEVQFVLHGVRVAYPMDKDEDAAFSVSEVTWRFDKQKAVSGEWVVVDNRIVLMPFSLSSMVRLRETAARLRVLVTEGLLDVRDEAFVHAKIVSAMQSEQVLWARDIFGHSKLVVRIKDLDGRGGKGDFLFDLRGAEKAVSPVLDACGW